MASGLIPKKAAIKGMIFLLLLSIVSMFLWQYHTSSRNYPFHISSEWHSNAPVFTLSYMQDDNGMLNSSEILEWNHEIIYVDVCFLMREYCVYPKNSDAYEDRLFSGTWHYRKGKLVLTIQEDYIFDNQFSELVFTSVSTN